MKRTIIFLALMLPTLAFAQWRIGANVGLSYNHPTIDKQYMTDLVYKDRWGVTFGLMGRYDYSPLSPFKVKTLEADHETITEPIVILANCGSISMAEMTTLGCQSLPNGSLIGKRTHGGLCSLSKDPSIYYQNYAGIVGEQDKTPVWLYIPQMVTMSKEKQIFEGVGLTPDIEVDFDITLSESTGRDTQLERALQFLRTGN